VIGRLKPGVSVAHAREEVSTIAARLAREYPDADEGVGGTVSSLHEAMVGDARPALLVLLGAFAGTALFLAALGIFGVMSYAVVQRSREIGICVALGANPQQVLGMVLGHASLLAVAGVGFGLAGALSLSRAMGSLLFELSPTDPMTLAGVAVLLLAVALLASYLPARQATRVDPLIALRSE
jgi:putative ABC transport system permease protein